MTNSSSRYLITVCQHRSCLRNGAAETLATFQRHQTEHLLVQGCECQGQCGSGPTVRVMPGNTWYCRVRPADADMIAEQHCQPDGQPVESLLNPRLHQTQAAYANLAEQYQAFTQSQPPD